VGLCAVDEREQAIPERGAGEPPCTRSKIAPSHHPLSPIAIGDLG